MATHQNLSLPYHLRAPRLRWASLAIDLTSSELNTLRRIAADSLALPRARKQASLLIGLHERVPIHDLCAELHMDRRTLFRMASELCNQHNRDRFVHQVRAA